MIYPSPFPFLEGSSHTRSTSPGVFKRIFPREYGSSGHCDIHLDCGEKSNGRSAAAGIMKARVPFIVAMLCGLAWAGKSFSGGHGSRLGCPKNRGLELSRINAVLTQWTILTCPCSRLQDQSLKLANDVEGLQS